MQKMFKNDFLNFIFNSMAMLCTVGKLQVPPRVQKYKRSLN